MTPDCKQDQAETSRLPRKGKESAQTMLADKYEAGLRKMEEAGYEEFGEAIEDHKIVIAALRAGAAPGAVREALESASEWCQTNAEQIGAVDGYDYRSGEEFGLRSASLELKKRALATPEESSTAAHQNKTLAEDCICNEAERKSCPACVAPSTAAGEAVELVRQLREKALWREDVHHDLHIAAANMIEKLAAPPAAQTDGVIEALGHACDRLQSFLDTFGDLGGSVTQADIDDWRTVALSRPRSGDAA